jgi:hypothetical protein
MVLVLMLMNATLQQRWSLPLAGLCLGLLGPRQLTIGSSAIIRAHQARDETLGLILLGLTGMFPVLVLLSWHAPRSYPDLEGVGAIPSRDRLGAATVQRPTVALRSAYAHSGH